MSVPLCAATSDPYLEASASESEQELSDLAIAGAFAVLSEEPCMEVLHAPKTSALNSEFVLDVALPAGLARLPVEMKTIVSYEEVTTELDFASAYRALGTYLMLWLVLVSVQKIVQLLGPFGPGSMGASTCY